MAAAQVGDAGPHLAAARAAFGDGHYADAWTALQEALAVEPENLEAMLMCARVLRRAGRNAHAAGLYESIARHRPDCVEAEIGLGAAYGALGRSGDAVRRLERAVALDPESHVAWCFLGEAAAEQGRIDDAIVAFERSLAIRPMNEVAYPKYLFYATFHEGFDSARLYRLNRAWGETLERNVEPRRHERNAAVRSGPLRIGYLSDEFYDRVTARFLEPVLRAHDPAAVTVTCFAANAVEDAVTARLRQTGVRWRPVAGLEAAQCAAAIAHENVDILVICTSYRVTSRAVLAYKPAPVQVCYSNLVSTTGLQATDYLVTEALTDPPGEDAHYTEKLVRLTNRNVYAPPEDAPDPGPLPCAAAGAPVTFASFNNLGKLTQGTIAAWANVLRAVPRARLMLKSVDRLRDVSTRRYFAQAFARHGIGLDRLVFLYGNRQRSEHLGRYREVDIALDPFPCNGGTTSCEALWMGVPLVTLAGQTFMGRQGINYLSKLGLADLVASDPASYVATAKALAEDRARLAALRSDLRSQVAARLFDPVAHARELEIAYRAMWERWRRGQAPAALNVAGNSVALA